MAPDWTLYRWQLLKSGERPLDGGVAGVIVAENDVGTAKQPMSIQLHLTAKTIAALNSDPTIGRAEALRRPMLELIDKGKPCQRRPSDRSHFIVARARARPRAGPSLSPQFCVKSASRLAEPRLLVCPPSVRGFACGLLSALRRIGLTPTRIAVTPCETIRWKLIETGEYKSACQ